MDSQPSEIHSKRAFKRTFVYLDRKETKAPTGKRLEKLKASQRVEDISFTRNHSASAIGRSLLATFPSLLGVDLDSLTFIKSYQSGHAMATVKTGLMSGNELVEEYSASHKKKVFFHTLQPAATRRFLTTMVASSSASTVATQPDTSTRQLLNAKASSATSNNSRTTQQGDQDCMITSGPSNGNSKDHVQVLTEDPEVVGNVFEEMSFFGLPSNKKKGGTCGRTEEVATLLETLLTITGGNLPPFLTHTLDEFLWQAREDAAICILFLFPNSALICEEAKAYIRYMFKVLKQEKAKTSSNVLFWLADSQSSEGNKVQAKYGVGNQSSLLILVPSHIPQCVEIFNEANFDHRKLKEALGSAEEFSKILQQERLNLNNRRQLIKEQDKLFKEQSKKQYTSTVSALARQAKQPSCKHQTEVKFTEQSTSTVSALTQQAKQPSCKPQSEVKSSEQSTSTVSALAQHAKQPSCEPQSEVKFSEQSTSTVSALAQQAKQPSCKPQSEVKFTEQSTSTVSALTQQAKQPLCKFQSEVKSSEQSTSTVSALAQHAKQPSCEPQSEVKSSEQSTSTVSALVQQAKQPSCEPQSEVKSSKQSTSTASLAQQAKQPSYKQQSEVKGKGEDANDDDDREEDLEVAFGPVQGMPGEKLDKTLEDELNRANEKKGKKKKTKKNKKKKKKRKAPQEQTEADRKRTKFDPHQ